MKRSPFVIFFIIIISYGQVFAQDTNIYNYKGGDSAFIRFLVKDILSNSESLNDIPNSAIVYCQISVDANGLITSITTLNDTLSLFSRHVINSVSKTKGNWLSKSEIYNLIVPFYFLYKRDIPNQGDSTIANFYYKDFLPVKSNEFVGAGIFVEPIVINLYGRIN